MRKRIRYGFVIISLFLLLFVLASCKAGGGEKDPSGEMTTQEEHVSEEETTTENKSEEMTTTEEKPEETTTEEKKPEETTTEEKKPEETTTEEKEEEKTPEIDESKAVTVWTTASLNLRKGPGTSYEVLTVLKSGREIKRYEVKDGWAVVKADGLVGYVSTDYLSDKKPEEKPSTSAKEETKKEEAIPGQHRDPNSAVVVIDPGHQSKGDSEKEPNGPGSSVMKARVTYGATGVATGVAESEMNLTVAKKLKTELENRGYTVYMTRTTQNVNISNKERALYASTVNADAVIRIHGNSGPESAKGAETLTPSAKNPYVSHLAAASKKLSKAVLDAYCKATGFANRGVKENDTMTGINWSEVPVTIIELGFMSNPAEDKKMQDPTVQNNMVQGMANGLDQYFGF